MSQEENNNGVLGLVILGVVALISLFIRKLIKIPKDTKGICIIGTVESGKTTLFEKITKLDLGSKSGGGTAKRDVKEVTIKIGERKIKLKESTDIGGGDLYVKEYDELIKDKDFVFIVFNLSHLMNSEKVKNKDKILDFQSRLLYLSKNELLEKKRYIVIGSHLDCIKGKDAEIENIKEEYYNLIGSNYFDNLPNFKIEKNFHLLNLLDEKQVNEFIENVFSKLK